MKIKLQKRMHNIFLLITILISTKGTFSLKVQRIEEDLKIIFVQIQQQASTPSSFTLLYSTRDTWRFSWRNLQSSISSWKGNFIFNYALNHSVLWYHLQSTLSLGGRIPIRAGNYCVEYSLSLYIHCGHF